MGLSTLLKALEFAQIRKEGGNRFHGRMKREKEQGSESVNEKPRSHTCRTPRCAKCCGILLEIWKWPDSPQGKVAGAYMGVEFVLAVAILVEGAEETAMGFPKRFGLDAPGTNRSLYMGTVGGVADAYD